VQASRADVVVVGAGPSGLIAARELAKKSVNVKVLEEHGIIGEPNHCAGLISIEGLERLGIRPSRQFVYQEITGGKVYSPSGESIRISSSRARAVVVDRTAFDQHLAQLAQDEGAEIETNNRVKSLIFKHERLAGVECKKNHIQTSLVIDAEGAGGSLARAFGYVNSNRMLLNGVNTDVSDLNIESNIVEVWFGRKIAPDFFSWIIPKNQTQARCGLACSSGDPGARLRQFLFNRFGKKTVALLKPWPVLVNGPAEKNVGNGFMLIGDVAGQTKPTTGGGVVMGGLCAIEASKVAIEALEKGDFSEKFLKTYEKKWRDKLINEIKAMTIARKIFNHIEDKEFEKLISEIKKTGLEKTLLEIIEKSDMDMQKRALISTVKNPKIMRVLIGTLGRYAFGEIKDLFKL
jgi:geranylgeranyl reductase family protein